MMNGCPHGWGKKMCDISPMMNFSVPGKKGKPTNSHFPSTEYGITLVIPKAPTVPQIVL